MVLPELGIKVGLNVFCPKCRSVDVIIEISNGGYCKFYKCNVCGFINEQLRRE